jgi:hypothetical protein
MLGLVKRFWAGAPDARSGVFGLLENPDAV